MTDIALVVIGTIIRDSYSSIDHIDNLTKTHITIHVSIIYI